MWKGVVMACEGVVMASVGAVITYVAVVVAYPEGSGHIIINPLNPELNPICYLLALLAHHFLHVSRIRVKSLTLRLLMSYIYI